MRELVYIKKTFILSSDKSKFICFISDIFDADIHIKCQQNLIRTSHDEILEIIKNCECDKDAKRK